MQFVGHRLLIKGVLALFVSAGAAACDANLRRGHIAENPAPPREITVTTPPLPPTGAGPNELKLVAPPLQITARTHELAFKTPALAGLTKVRVTLPHGYDPDGQKRYPVVYLLHGGVSNHTTWTATDGGDLEALTPTAPVIFIMPDAAGNPPVGVGNYVDWYNQGDFGPPEIETYHMRQLVPWVDQHYKTVPNRNARATAGFSMGGHGAFQYARHFPDLIGVSASFSGSIDNTQRTSDWRNGGAGIAKDIWGDYAKQEIRWRASGTVDEAKNLSNTNLFLTYGDRGHPENNYIRLGAEAVMARFRHFNIPFAARPYTAAAHTWATAKRGFSAWLPGAAALLSDPNKQRRQNPSAFSYTTIDEHYQVFGWNVAIARIALEFSSLEVVDEYHFRVIGSGNAKVQTPRLRQPNAIYAVSLNSAPPDNSKTIYVKTDATGRAVIPVSLGPANPFQQFTVEADAGSESTGPDRGDLPFTVRGTGSRFYSVDVTLKQLRQ